jgi:hypothetical protein
VGGRIDGMADVVVKYVGVNAMIQSLQQLEPETYKQLRKDIRFITAPAVSAVKSNVPTISPFAGRRKDGFTHSGRTAWSGASVTTNITPAQRSRAYGSTTSNLVAISATGQNKQFGFNILDMAGRGTGRGRNPKSRTRPYEYKGGTRTHRLNGQGQAMIQALNTKPSRYFYPAIENQLPEIRRRVETVIDKVAANMNRKIGKM